MVKIQLKEFSVKCCVVEKRFLLLLLLLLTENNNKCKLNLFANCSYIDISERLPPHKIYLLT